MAITLAAKHGIKIGAWADEQIARFRADRLQGDRLRRSSTTSDRSAIVGGDWEADDCAAWPSSLPACLALDSVTPVQQDGKE